MNLEELNNRLETLEAIEAIKKLKARYCQCADERDAEGYADLFTEEWTKSWALMRASFTASEGNKTDCPRGGTRMSKGISHYDRKSLIPPVVAIHIETQEQAGHIVF